MRHVQHYASSGRGRAQAQTPVATGADYGDYGLDHHTFCPHSRRAVADVGASMHRNAHHRHAQEGTAGGAQKAPPVAKVPYSGTPGSVGRNKIVITTAGGEDDW